MKKNGFTLIELLVVISIIALLMSIMMPALSKVKEEAQKISCMARLRQWATPIQMYTQENSGKFSSQGGSNYTDESNRQRQKGSFVVIYKDFWLENPEIFLCPSATKTLDEGTPDFGRMARWLPAAPHWGINRDYKFSYGYSNFCYNTLDLGGNNWKNQYFWQTIEQRNPEKIPLMGGCIKKASWGFRADEPPEYSGQFSDRGTGAGTNQMRQWCVDRHGSGALNMLFMDFTVRTVSLKQLWRLKHSKMYDLPTPADPLDKDWPDWMKQIRESYD